MLKSLENPVEELDQKANLAKNEKSLEMMSKIK